MLHLKLAESYRQVGSGYVDKKEISLKIFHFCVQQNFPFQEKLCCLVLISALCASCWAPSDTDLTILKDLVKQNYS